MTYFFIFSRICLCINTVKERRAARSTSVQISFQDQHRFLVAQFPKRSSVCVNKSSFKVGRRTSLTIRNLQIFISSSFIAPTHTYTGRELPNFPDVSKKCTNSNRIRTRKRKMWNVNSNIKQHHFNEQKVFETHHVYQYRLPGKLN